MTMSEEFAKECRDEVKYYRERAAQAKKNGLQLNRETLTKLAISNRARARRWASEKTGNHER